MRRPTGAWRPRAVVMPVARSARVTTPAGRRRRRGEAGPSGRPGPDRRLRRGEPGCVDETIARDAAAARGRWRDVRPPGGVRLHVPPRDTEEYRRRSPSPTRSTTSRSSTGLDALFAGFYFRRVRQLRGGDVDPGRSGVADRLRPGGGRRGDRAGDAMLGINAHINRDLPFVLEAARRRRPDGRSRRDRLRRGERSSGGCSCR